MEKRGKTWKHVEKRGKTWKTVEKYGKTWKTLGKHEKTWKPVGKRWGNVENRGNPLQKRGKTWKESRGKWNCCAVQAVWGSGGLLLYPGGSSVPQVRSLVRHPRKGNLPKASGRLAFLKSGCAPWLPPLIKRLSTTLAMSSHIGRHP